MHSPDTSTGSQASTMDGSSQNQKDNGTVKSPTPNSGQQDSPNTATSEECSQDDELDPAQHISAYGWEDLESRFHKQMENQNVEDRKMYQEFDKLLQVRSGGIIIVATA
jgi:hypothetical protein